MNKSTLKLGNMKYIKFSALIILSLSLIEACDNSSNENATLVQLKADKSRFQDSIKQIDLRIKKLDTVKRVIYPKVTLFETATAQFEHYFAAQGYVESDQNVLLIPEVGGVVKALNVEEGQIVNKGQVIASFDAALIASNINELEEQLTLAEYNFNKQKSLYDQGVASEFNVKQAEGQYKTLQKTLETLRTQAGKSTLVAPFTGYIEDLIPVVGELSPPGVPVARLISLEKVHVAADISEFYLSRLNTENSASVSFSALDVVVDNLKISSIGRFVNPTNRTLKIRVNLPRNDQFIPNLVATIRIRDYVKDSAIVVPSSAITQDSKGRDIVFVGQKEDKHFLVKSMAVEPGMTYGGFTEIKSGLSVGMNVINQGSQSVYDGLAVEELINQ